MKPLLTPQQAADKLNVKLSTIYNWTHIGFIPHVKMRRFVRFQDDVLDRWLKGMENKGRQTRGPQVF